MKHWVQRPISRQTVRKKKDLVCDITKKELAKFMIIIETVLSEAQS